MLKLLRYTLAAIFLAASVACLGLWWRSATTLDHTIGPSVGKWLLEATSFQGAATVSLRERTHLHGVNLEMWLESVPHQMLMLAEKQEAFRLLPNGIRFPLWYPALVFALAAGGVLRLGQRFTIRSALIATTVVAALLGMMVVF